MKGGRARRDTEPLGGHTLDHVNDHGQAPGVTFGDRSRK